MRAVRQRASHALLFPVLILSTLAVTSIASQGQDGRKRRPVIGVAFGGGSALGLAHVGVIKWFEDHHVPIDVVAGTSMGGLVGGAYATGMSSEDLAHLLAHTDWDEMFGSSTYRYRSVQRKEDIRLYPSRLEFEMKRGVRLQSALNNGQQVDLFLARIAALYAGLPSFDALPTPFRCVAFDVRAAERVVLDSGSLVQAMRATMSLPGIFPPVEMGDKLLVDGGTVDNVPADVARAMGADVVIAVNVGRLPDSRDVGQSLLSVAGGTIDAMMRASTRRGLAAADIVVNPVLRHFSGLDWQRAPELAKHGYDATEEKRESLLKYAVSDDEWRRYQAARAAKRRTRFPVIDSIEVVGATPDDERSIRHRLRSLIGHRLEVAKLDAALLRVSALDRYESVAWDFAVYDGRESLLIRARLRPNAPPLGMFAFNAQNLTTDDYTFQLAVRYLAFDAVLPDAELRLDLAIASNPRVAGELRHSLGSTPFFAAGQLGAFRVRREFANANTIVAQYDQGEVFAQLDLGASFDALSELRLGARAGYLNARRRIGNPALPNLDGIQTEARFLWIFDSQTRYIAPQRGLRLVAGARYVFSSPDPEPPVVTTATDDGLTQADLQGSQFWSARGKRDRVFLTGAGGSSFGNHPLPTEQYALGLPFRLDGFSVGERRGDNYWVLTGGYLYGVGALPAFFGGAAYLGGWLENGAVWGNATNDSYALQVGIGALVETLLGPALLGVTFGGHGTRQVHIGFGGIFP
jgi:NTE family protein